MELDPKDSAKAAINHADPVTRKFILEMALERARSQHTMTIALDQRITQASYLQFAAAAVASVFVGVNFAVSTSGGLALIASVAFVIGGALCFRGVRSDPYHAPGLPPAWWLDITNHADFCLADAQCWAAGELQFAMDHTETENSKRAESLNMSLRCSLVGALFMFLAAASRLVLQP